MTVEVNRARQLVGLGPTEASVYDFALATDADQLLRPAIAALGAQENLLVVAVTGGADPASVFAAAPANTRIEPFLPFDRLLAHVDVIVTNGGYGGVQLALAHGVPIVAAGRLRDEIVVAGREQRAADLLEDLADAAPPAGHAGGHRAVPVGSASRR